MDCSFCFFLERLHWIYGSVGNHGFMQFHLVALGHDWLCWRNRFETERDGDASHKSHMELREAAVFLVHRLFGYFIATVSGDAALLSIVYCFVVLADSDADQSLRQHRQCFSELDELQEIGIRNRSALYEVLECQVCRK